MLKLPPYTCMRTTPYCCLSGLPSPTRLTRPGQLATAMTSALGSLGQDNRESGQGGRIHVVEDLPEVVGVLFILALTLRVGSGSALGTASRTTAAAQGALPSRAVPITVGAVGDNVRADNAADQGSLGVLALGALVLLLQFFAIQVPDHGITVLAVSQIDVVRNRLERPAVDLGAQLQLADRATLAENLDDLARAAIDGMHEHPNRQVWVSSRQRRIVVKRAGLHTKNSGGHIASPGRRVARDLLSATTREGLGVLRQGRHAFVGSARNGS